MSQNLPIQLFGGGFHLNFNLVLKSYVVINIQHCNYFATQQEKEIRRKSWKHNKLPALCINDSERRDFYCADKKISISQLCKSFSGTVFVK